MSNVALNIYSCKKLINVSTTAADLFSFGFPAQYVRVDNLGSVDVFPNFNNALPTSTVGFTITSCSISGLNRFEYYAPPVSLRAATADMTMEGIGLGTTSTVSGGQLVAVLAIG